MKTKQRLALQVAATIAGEDIACGDYIALLTQSYDVPSYMWDGIESTLSPHELVRLTLVPDTAGYPMKVLAVCLPFVYVKTPCGGIITIDTRQCHLVRLERKCAKTVWKALRGKRGKKRGRK